jgi:hypothetical protein
MCSRISYFEEKEISKKERRNKEELYKHLDMSKSSQHEFMVMGGAPDEASDTYSLDDTRRQMIDRRSALQEVIL